MAIDICSESQIANAIANLEKRFSCSIGWRVDPVSTEVYSGYQEIGEDEYREAGWKVLGEHPWPPTDEGIVYFLERADGLVKIGFTENFAQRRSQLQAVCGRMKLLRWFGGTQKTERLAHRVYSSVREEREYFNLKEFRDWETAVCPFNGCYLISRSDNDDSRRNAIEYLNCINQREYCEGLIYVQDGMTGVA